MRPSEHDQESLLSDLFNGPDVEAVLGTIRREKAAMQRRRRVAAGAALVVFAVSACLWSLRHEGNEGQQTAAHPHGTEAASSQIADTASSAPLQVERINDEQLIQLLEGNPVALVHLPTGEQRLLLVGDHNSEAEASIISL